MNGRRQGRLRALGLVCRLPAWIIKRRADGQAWRRSEPDQSGSWNTGADIGGGDGGSDRR